MALMLTAHLFVSLRHLSSSPTLRSMGCSTCQESGRVYHTHYLPTSQGRSIQMASLHGKRRGKKSQNNSDPRQRAEVYCEWGFSIPSGWATVLNLMSSMSAPHRRSCWSPTCSTCKPAPCQCTGRAVEASLSVGFPATTGHS